MRVRENKPVILAICGKSASGKDTLAKELIYYLNNENIPCQYIVSDTTRPLRVTERNGVEYHFISSFDFIQNQTAKLYLETSSFRGWRYGTHKNSIVANKINIGVFNPEGIRNLRRYKEHFLIIPIYLKEDIIIRLRRSYERENRWRFEYIRRAFVDWKNFKDIEYLLNYFD